MKSITKSSIPKKIISIMIQKAFGNKISAVNIIELTDGYFNNSYKILLSNSKTVVLKVSPKNNVKVLTYEKNLMESEVFVNNIMYDLYIPSPKILFYDKFPSFIECEYFFMSYIEGTPLNLLKGEISLTQLEKIYSSLGSIMKPLITINNNTFGEIINEKKQYTNWFECYKNMLFDLMKDAKNINLNLPISNKEINNILIKYQDILNQVTIPSLVHKDLWDGNIFINKESLNIVGIIDSERAIYADPLMEITCGHLDENKDFIYNYLSKKDLTQNEKIRINLYKLYLYILMIVECPYRKYETDNQYIWATKKLQETIINL